ncbi:MAG: DUF445 family protein [Firmicutes bacterium]|nr:DUF445 family protein [Bacillota bacterium]
MTYVWMAVFGGLIGWFTNWLAVRMLFRPRRPIRVGPWRIQGVIPARRAALARAMGQAVAERLLSAEELLQELAHPALREQVAAQVVAAAAARLGERLGWLPPPLSQLAGGWLGGIVRREVHAFFAESLDKLLEEARAGLDIAAMVEERVEAFSAEELERLFLDIMRRELRFVEWVGGAIGALVGLGEAALSGWLR